MNIQDYRNATDRLNQFHKLALCQYVCEIIYQGDPNKWYHGREDPLQHNWIYFTSFAICSHCKRTVKNKRILVSRETIVN